MSGRGSFDLEVIRAAAQAAPIFAANQWEYATHPGRLDCGYEVPDVTRLATSIQRLVDHVREHPIDPDGPEEQSVSRGSGRFKVRRDVYLKESAEDITISLQLAVIESE